MRPVFGVPLSDWPLSVLSRNHHDGTYWIRSFATFYRRESQAFRLRTQPNKNGIRDADAIKSRGVLRGD